MTSTTTTYKRWLWQQSAQRKPIPSPEAPPITRDTPPVIVASNSCHRIWWHLADVSNWATACGRFRMDTIYHGVVRATAIYQYPSLEFAAHVFTKQKYTMSTNPPTTLPKSFDRYDGYKLPQTPWYWIPQGPGRSGHLVSDARFKPVVLAANRDGAIVTRGPQGLLEPLRVDHPIARLISAAPDLLAALEELLRTTVENDIDNDIDIQDEARQAVQQANAAIAKARGTQP